MSRQIGWPEGASAAWGSVMPSASATTCDVAAVPRNWQPPPGLAQARQPSSAASGRVSSPWAKRAPIDWILPASSPSRGGKVTPPGTSTPGRCFDPARAIIMAGRPLSQVAIAEHAFAARQRSDQAPEDDRRVVAIRQAVHHPGRALRAAVARVGDHPGERDDVEPPQFLGRFLDEQADLPVARVIPQRDRLAVGPAQAALGAQDQVRVARDLARRPAHAGVLGQAEQVARGPVWSISSVSGSEPAGPSALVVTS